MDERSLEKTLTELLQTVGINSAAPEIASAVQTTTQNDQLHQAVSNLQDSLDYLRLTVKYLLFDLEATRRENAHLRKMLEEDPNANGEQSGGEGE
ncbi:MAG: hypothetical protein KF841_15865 [Phycisphaerae bacterium]|nr:hypothetical protein [Phycisphaerae bacterium]